MALDLHGTPSGEQGMLVQNGKSPTTMDVLTAIAQRRAVRRYYDRPVELATVSHLLELATRAPSAINSQPWAFVIVHDRQILHEISERAKAHWLAQKNPELSDFGAMLRRPEFDIFYGASVLVVICAKSQDPQAARDCYLAGENLMLAATEMGLATCPIGFAWPALAAADIKARLRIPATYEAVLPIVLGYGNETPHPTPRREPEVLYCDLT